MPCIVLDSITPDTVTCAGYCRACGREHLLHAGQALELARRLMGQLEEHGRIDFDVPQAEADPRFGLDYLNGPARGQMFGVLAYRDARGHTGALKAFSCQYNGAWLVPGWVPPVVDAQVFARIHDPVERRIKALGREMGALPAVDPRRPALKQQRKALAQQNMKDLHALYQLHNFRGLTRSMAEVFLGPGGLPTGTGDCCAPKLVQYAARNGLTPTGLVEFYWGRENSSGTRHQGEFYPACPERCAPILGFMLCGLEGQGRGGAVDLERELDSNGVTTEDR
ncbi:MAG: hypothetical protein KKE73_03410 [Proteobacteria bacterium]|nr:hypothetical protein [Pseudomonadota bacterium]